MQNLCARAHVHKAQAQDPASLSEGQEVHGEAALRLVVAVLKDADAGLAGEPLGIGLK